jgi:hypothetical protein
MQSYAPRDRRQWKGRDNDTVNVFMTLLQWMVISIFEELVKPNFVTEIHLRLIFPALKTFGKLKNQLPLNSWIKIAF